MNYTMTCLRTNLNNFFTRSVQINALFMDLHILAKKAIFFHKQCCECNKFGAS